MKYIVRVFSGSVEIESLETDSEIKAQVFASYWQDNGYKVRFTTVA